MECSKGEKGRKQNGKQNKAQNKVVETNPNTKQI